MKLSELASLPLISMTDASTALRYLAVIPLLSQGAFKVAEIEDGPMRSVGVVTRRSGRFSHTSEKAIALVRHSTRELVNQTPAWLSDSVDTAP